MGVPVADLVLATAAATLVLATAGAGLAMLALLRARQVQEETTRLALSVDTAIREMSAEVRRDVPATRRPVAIAAQPTREIILRNPAETAAESPRPARRYMVARLPSPAP